MLSTSSTFLHLGVVQVGYNSPLFPVLGYTEVLQLFFSSRIEGSFEIFLFEVEILLEKLVFTGHKNKYKYKDEN